MDLSASPAGEYAGMQFGIWLMEDGHGVSRMRRLGIDDIAAELPMHVSGGRNSGVPVQAE